MSESRAPPAGGVSIGGTKDQFQLSYQLRTGDFDVQVRLDSVTLADASQRGIAWREVPGYILAQIGGAFAGVAAAHLMFGLPLFSASRHARFGGAQAFSEFVATFGLLSVIWGCVRFRASAVPFAVAAYITAAYWFTASTSFANPAVTLALLMGTSVDMIAKTYGHLSEEWVRRVQARMRGESSGDLREPDGPGYLLETASSAA